MNLDLIYRIAGKRVEKRRKEAQMTQQQLAERLKMLRTSVTNIEAGRQRPPLHVWYLLAEIFNCEPHDFFPRRANEYDWEFEAESRDETAERLLEKLAILVQAVKEAPEPSPALKAELEGTAERALKFTSGEWEKPA